MSSKISNELTCFKVYDVRGEVGINFDTDIAYRIARAFVERLDAKSVVVGYDARDSSEAICMSICKGIQDSGADVFNLGLCGTEEMYFSTAKLNSSGGIQVTASHNPLGFNGLKMIGADAKPLEPNKEIIDIKHIAERNDFICLKRKGCYREIGPSSRDAYVEKVISFSNLSNIRPLKIVMNFGNGAAGPTFDQIEKKLKSLSTKIDFVHMYHDPDPSFPNGIPNPMLKENQLVTGQRVVQENADLGIAFDGDFDRCFFFDDKGRFVDGEYVIGLLLEIFLLKEEGATIVHDPRVVWNIQDLTAQFGGTSVESKTGHAFIKQKMREENAIYGGEISGHHYFKDFYYCDSGMIPWIVLCEAIGKKDISLSEIISERKKLFPSLGEVNFSVIKPSEAVNRVLKWVEKNTKKIDFLDGLTAEFRDWRFNLRVSNTENFIRLNMEARRSVKKIEKYSEFIKNLLLAD